MKLLNFEEVREILRVSRPTLLRLLNDGSLPGVRVGDQWRVREDLLMAALDPRPASAEERDHAALR